MDGQAQAQAFDVDELELMAEALVRLREDKIEAHAALVGLPGHAHLTPRDFGIPVIDRMLEKVGGLLETGGRSP